MKKTKLLLHKRILVAVLSGGMLLLPNWGYAMPSLPVLPNGVTRDDITTSGDQMTITGSGNMAIDWDSFNVGNGKTVNFTGMNAVLNYVIGNTKSEIFGNITGENVHVFLVNPNGILFGAEAKVNVGQLTASTRAIEDRTVFNGSAFSTLSAEAAQKVRGDIINLGELTANKIVLEGDNISLLNAATLKIKNNDNSNITLRANEKITVGYETSNYVTGAVSAKSAVDKGSVALAGANLECLNNKNKTGIAITDAMLVHNVDDLQAINNNLAGDYMLANDIDAKDATGFKSIGHMDYDDTAGGFSGTLDGLNCEIKNLTIEMTNNNNVGLFNIILEGASVKNLQMTNSSITGNADVGSIVGKNYGTISNVTNEANITAGSFGEVGGIVGVNYGKLDNVINKGTITSTGTSLGGIAGINIGGTISNASNEAAIEAKGNYVGGIVGSNSAGGKIINSENNGKITGNNVSYIGGICGDNKGSIQGCTNNAVTDVIINDGTLTDIDITNGQFIGGIVGYNNANAEILNSHNKQEIKGGKYVGGIAGINNSLIGGENGSSNSGSVTGTGDYVGGIVGASKANKNTIENCNNSGDVSGASYVGGIAGTNSNENTTEESRISDSSNSGSVTGKGNFVGGIVGYNNYNGTSENKAVIENCTNSGAADKKISGTGYVGGIVGYNTGDVINVINNIAVTGTGDFVGGIVGRNSATIKQAYNQNTVNGGKYIGGIAGYSSGTLTDVHNEKNGTVTGTTNTGGIVGYNTGTIGVDDTKNTTVTNAGNIIGTSYVGGIVGYNTGVIGEEKDGKSVTNSGAVSGSGSTIGGIVGYNKGTNSSITKAYNSGTVTGSGTTSTYIGGISGKNEGTLTDVHNEKGGTVTGSGYVGGISGYNTGTIGDADKKTSVTNSGAIEATGFTSNGKPKAYVGGITGYNTGNILKAANKGKVTGSGDYVGGIVANNSKGTISDSYNIGDVKGDRQQVSGISGYNTGTIQNVYNSGKIDGTYYVGGIVGYSSGGTVANAYNIGQIIGKDGFIGGVVGDGSGTVTNAYYASFDGDAIAGYLKYQGDDTLLSLEEFGQAFESDLRDEDKDSWKFYNGNTTPLLKGFLKKITIDGDTISGVDAVYNGSEQIAGLGGLADGILVGAKKEIGTYTLKDLLYSGQDGYDITILNDGIKFTIREVPPDEPQQPSQPAVPQEGIYQNALVNIAITERENRPEQQNIRQRIIDSPIKVGEEQAKVRIEGDGIKFGKEQIRVKVDDDGIKIEEEA